MAPGNIKNFELRLRRLGLIIVIVGMATLICFAFLLGVKVGENIDTYPKQIASLPQRVLAFIWRPAKLQTVENATDDKEQVKDEENIDLTFYKTLTSEKSAAKEQPSAEKEEIAATPTQQQAVSTSKTEEETPTIDSNLEAKKEQSAIKGKTRDKSKKKIKDTTPAAAFNKQKFIIQAASLKEKAKAYQVSQKIAQLGFKTLIVPVEIKGKGIWFRVLVSGFENKNQAQMAAAKISKTTGGNCILRHVDTEGKKN